MKIKILSQVLSNGERFEAGSMLSMRDADALPLIKAGAADPVGKNAQTIVEALEKSERTVMGAALAAAISAAQLSKEQSKASDLRGGLLPIQNSGHDYEIRFWVYQEVAI